MHSLTVTIICVFIIRAYSNVEHGAHNTVLLDEGESYDLPCIPNSDAPSEEELKNHKVFESAWYNVTPVIFNPDEHLPKDDISRPGVEITYNEHVIHATSGQLLLRNVTPDLTGYYECVARFADTFEELHEEDYAQTRHIRHLLEVTSPPIWVVVMHVSYYTRVSAIDLEAKVTEKTKQIASSSTIANLATVADDETKCSAIRAALIECRAVIELRPPTPKVTAWCDKVCALFKMVNRLRKDVGEIRRVLDFHQERQGLESDYDVVKINAEQTVVTDYRDCPLGYWRDLSHCRPCHPGKYRNVSMALCKSCPKDHYQDKFAQTGCKPCPNEQITIDDSEGVSSVHSCREHGFFGNLREGTNDILRDIFE